MPTFPLYNLQPPHPDGWHSVRAPGGYEGWYFDAEDKRNDRQLVVIFSQGFVFHPGYLRADARYRRHPTRIAPAIAADYPCVYFVVYERGRIRGQFLTQFSPADFIASTESAGVQIGLNQIIETPGNLQVCLKGTPGQFAGRGPRLIEGSEWSAELCFTTKASPALPPRRLISHEISSADHFWIPINPHCDVSGSIRLNGNEFSFTGRGYHDHHFGSAPLGPGLRRWMRGRAMTDAVTQMFQWAQPKNAGLPDELQLLRFYAQGAHELSAVAPPFAGEKLTAAGLRYPTELVFSNDFRLSQPRVLDASPFYLRLQYNAWLDHQQTTALCEIAYPHRLRWPLLSRFIEKSIDKTGAQR